MLQQETLSEYDKQKIYSYFTNKQISQLLENQLKQLYKSNISKEFMITISKQTLHLYISFHRIKALENGVIQQPLQYGCYAIKITKSFPLVNGIRLHIFNNSYSPRLFDCRDIIYDVLGHAWKHTNTILDIFESIDKFQIKLFGRNNQGLPMQMTGQFKLGDTFDIHQLKKFSAMELFQDLSRENAALISTTQTHLLTLKQIPQKQNQKEKVYQLVRVCQLQCISQLYHNKKQKQIIVSLNKYRNIKSFDEAEKISRKYKFQDAEQFIRNILKNIDRFQKTQISLQLGSGWSKEDKMQKRIQMIKQLEQCLQQASEENKRKQVVTKLTQQYQKIIQFFLSRAHSYYLVYVTKLNKIHSLSQKD